MYRRAFHTARQLWHENPLGLPRSGAPPQIPRMQRGLPQKQKIKNVNKVIAVSSAKGGVGKSTVAVNLALGLSSLGRRTGILDTDIFGPSIPRLLNLSGEPRLSEKNQLIPLSNYGLQSMSMGYLVDPENAVVWRGLMVMKALQQLLHEVEWSELDVLVLDLPPGTGDTQLTITQQVELDGAVIISTPQDIALIDAIKGIDMFSKVKVPVSTPHSSLKGPQYRLPGGPLADCHLNTFILDSRNGAKHEYIHLSKLLALDTHLRPRRCEQGMSKT
ncbi:hypothetical protein TWF225_007025 [Orbilia oligospora]|nr:hypothetical protein TWF225_007025 [Orbilia oligospora]KAF3245430.1 hypothetical protein TWF128_009457 [Orbilia oligospora]KAF3251878.1 hypothetical protein TWF217_007864 [Orbilia oligospora]